MRRSVLPDEPRQIDPRTNVFAIAETLAVKTADELSHFLCVESLSYWHMLAAVLLCGAFLTTRYVHVRRQRVRDTEQIEKNE